MDPNYKRNRIILYLIVVMIVILYGLYHYDFFNQSGSTTPKLEDAIKLGREYSYAIFTNQPKILTRHSDSLYEISVGNAKEKIQKLTGDQNWRLEAKRLYDENKGSAERFKHIVILGVNEYNLELNALVRYGGYVDLQFVYHEFPVVINGHEEYEECTLCRSIEISDKGPMSYLITTRYELYTDDRIGAVILNKIFNFTPISFVYNLLLFIPYNNTRGHWVVSDYNYNYNLNDYYDWLSKN